MAYRGENERCKVKLDRALPLSGKKKYGLEVSNFICSKGRNVGVATLPYTFFQMEYSFGDDNPDHISSTEGEFLVERRTKEEQEKTVERIIEESPCTISDIHPHGEEEKYYDPVQRTLLGKRMRKYAYRPADHIHFDCGPQTRFDFQTSVMDLIKIVEKYDFF